VATPPSVNQILMIGGVDDGPSYLTPNRGLRRLRRGGKVESLSVPAASQHQVAVSLTELTDAGVPFLGDASMGVLNVVPHDGGRIIVKGHVDFPNLLRVQLNFIIVN
jgi:hypothetical protein